jgi:hypothetical protein
MFSGDYKTNASKLQLTTKPFTSAIGKSPLNTLELLTSLSPESILSLSKKSESKMRTPNKFTVRLSEAQYFDTETFVQPIDGKPSIAIFRKGPKCFDGLPTLFISSEYGSMETVLNARGIKNLRQALLHDGITLR